MEPDTIVIPVGGGGLLAGMVTVIQHLKPNIKIIVCLFDGLQAAASIQPICNSILYSRNGISGSVQVSSSMTACS